MLVNQTGLDVTIAFGAAAAAERILPLAFQTDGCLTELADMIRQTLVCVRAVDRAE